jgi:mRNA interferase MazF
MLTSGDVVEVELGVPEGSEAGMTRPAVVVTAQAVLDAGSRIVHVVPLTRTLRGYASEIRIEPDGHNGLGTTSSAQCQHIRAVAISRVGSPRGNVGVVALAQIRQTLGVLLDT